MDTNRNVLVVAAVFFLYAVTATATVVQETDPCTMPPPVAQDDPDGFEKTFDMEADKAIAEGFDLFEMMFGKEVRAAIRYDPAALHRVGIALWQWTTCGRDESVPESLRNRDGDKGIRVDSESFSVKRPMNVTALALLSAAAAAGNKSSQAVLWHAYGALQADGGLTHLSKIGAGKLFQQAYFQDDPDAQYHLGRRYNRWWDKLGSYGPSELEPLAQFWWERAAQRGHSDAQAWLGRTLVGLERLNPPRLPLHVLFGWGKLHPAPSAGANKRLVTKGWKWIEQAASQGSPHALFDLGIRLIHPEIDDGEMRVYNYAGMAYDSDEAVNDVQRGMDFLREAAAKAEGPEAPWYALDLANLLSWNAATASLDDLPPHERVSLEKSLSRIRELLEVDFHLSPPEVAQGQALARELFARISVNSEPSPKAESARQGTGILFAGGTVAVTSHHVVAGCSRVDVVGDSQERSAAVVGVDGGNDLVLLELDRSLRGGDAHLRPRAKVSVGERAVVASFPFTSGDGFTVTTGNISATRGPAGRTGLFQLTAPIQQGNSGGPVIGADGAILGVVVSKLDAIAVAAATGDLPQNVNYAVHGAVLRTFLDLNGVDYRTLARLGRRSDAELADEARRFTVLVTCTPDTQPSGTDVAVH